VKTKVIRIVTLCLVITSFIALCKADLKLLADEKPPIVESIEYT